MNITTALSTIRHTEKLRRISLPITRATAPLVTLGHRYGPEVLTGVGIAGGLGTVILASRATLQLEAIVDRTDRLIKLAELEHDHKAIRKARVDGIYAIAKLYAPSATLGAASAGAILGAHGIMHRRNVAIAAAYKAIETSFAEYRKRVADEFGEEKDEDFRRGFTTTKVKDEETGKTVTQTVVNPNAISPYARFFDEDSPNWSKTSEYNLVFLRAQQNYANDLLQTRGHLFLNEIYDLLGLPRSQAGAACGWALTKGSDNFVDFGIYDFDNDRRRMFVNGKENRILLDFNVDGVILDKI